MKEIRDLRTEQFEIASRVINGGVAGMVGILLVFPLDLVKTRLQIQQFVGATSSIAGEETYNSILDCFRKTYAAEGFSGMYRGSAVNILFSIPDKAIQLTINDFFRHNFTLSNGELPIYKQMIAGGLAGGSKILLATPMELLETQLQIAGRVESLAKREGKTIAQVTATSLAINHLRENGVAGLYRGSFATAFRDITFSLIFFPMFAALNALGPRQCNESDKAVFWCAFLSGLFATPLPILIVTPIDVIRTRIQTSGRFPGNRKFQPGNLEFQGIIDCFRKTMKHEGPRAFFKGGLCRIMVAMPLCGITQMVYYLGMGEAIVNWWE